MVGKCNLLMFKLHNVLRKVRLEGYLDVSVCGECSVVQRSQQAGALLAMLLSIYNITYIILYEIQMFYDLVYETLNSVVKRTYSRTVKVWRGKKHTQQLQDICRRAK